MINKKLALIISALMIIAVACATPKRELNETFTTTVYTGTLDQVEKQVIDGASVNSMDSKSFTAAHYAAARGDMEIVKYLEGKSADYKAEDSSKATPLHHAAFRGNYDVVKFLVEDVGVDVNKKTSKGYTPLDRAAIKGHEKIVKYLIDKKAKVDAKSDGGETALHMAVYSGDLGTVKELVGTKGVDIDAKENRGYTPLHYAAYFGYEPIVDYLLDKKAEINSASKEGKTPMDVAKISKKTKIVKLLQARGAK